MKTLEEYKQEQMKNPELRKEYEAMDNGRRFLRKVIEEVKSMSSEDYNSFLERAQDKHG